MVLGLFAKAQAWARPGTAAPGSSGPAIDLGTVLAEVSAQRSSGVRVPASTYSEVMLGCIDAGIPFAAYRVYEEAIADGLRFDELSLPAQEALRTRLPPEAEACKGHAVPPLPPSPASGRVWCDPLPDLWVAGESAPSQVAEFDCSQRAGERRNANIAAAWEAISEREAPVLLRGVGEHWPALSEWTLDLLLESMERAMVRVSPSASVTFCRESHPDVVAGKVEPPSRTFSMTTTEFADRLRLDRNGRRPLVYGEDERVYLQALAPHEMMRRVDFDFLAAASEKQPDSVLGRLWVSAPGTVSPLHFDQQDSYLCQVRGVKRMLLWPDTLLPNFEPYSADHPLARRLQTSILAPAPPDLESSERLQSLASPLEAVLRPGDVLYFPSCWPHHTEALPLEADPAVGWQRPNEAAAAGGDAGGADEALLSFSLGFRTDGQFLL